MSQVEIEVAEPEQRIAIENMMQLYTHDFSEQWVGRPEGELDEKGRFADYPLDAFWVDRDRIPLLIRVDGRLAGFALLDTHSHAGRELDRNMGEFFVARKYRRGGVGLRAAHAIFARWPGRWEAAVARRNFAALAFWRKAVAQHPNLVAAEEVERNGSEWNGPVLCFTIKP